MRIGVLLSTAGGGDRQPVVALAVALAEAGHDVTIVCDAGSASLVSSAGLPTLAHDADQVGYITAWAKQLGDISSPPNPFIVWGETAASSVREDVQALNPDVIVSSLFCMGLANILAEGLGIPWCFVNPSFYFGPQSYDAWEADWYGSFVPRLARDCFAPLAGDADLVLHATDPLFDPLADLPDAHHQVGFLLWESSDDQPDVLDRPGDPWALVTASTSRPDDEQTMLDAAVGALADQPVRTILTLPKHNPAGQATSNVVVAGYMPHTPILKRSVLSINQAGHGIVSKCLRYGVPMVLTPWDADQPGVAARAAALGVASIVSRADISMERLTAAVSDVLGDAAYLRRARELSDEFAGRDAEGHAVSLIQGL